ncbi:uncharacterized protein LOC128675274 [Plodia interpunctella]|uniref:uncharacterized protein LOC128675274 n=1 Tax=Plodia interpunctella TaxID=58824 RepID=UPI002367F8CE|nr:uncharacterized protein LOC128675274 [Plodia interpunctella]
MQKVETAWKKDGDWKARYSRLYSCHRTSSTQREQEPRISFMTNDAMPFSSLSKVRTSQQDSSGSGNSSPRYLTSLLSQRSELYSSSAGSQYLQNDNLGGHETLLLDMVRARSREIQEAQDQTLDLPQDVSDDQSSEVCMHGLTMRMTERSISRSRVSRISTRRDMDIPSILAFTTNVDPPLPSREIPAFQRLNAKQEDKPRWSIRRSVCPVCSQKWKDRSSINIVKNSGLKRNSSMELPSVIAPARLRSSITIGYVPRPALVAVDEELGINRRVFRNSSASWQLIRARRFRAPKPIMPSPEASRPPIVTEPLAQKDLDTRVYRFLTDEDVKLIW